jgi:hypothetical protein
MNLTEKQDYVDFVFKEDSRIDTQLQNQSDNLKKVKEQLISDQMNAKSV